MSWETRGSKRYYYRKLRKNGRVMSKYVGTGFIAEAQAIFDAEKGRSQKEWEKQVRAVEALMAELDGLEQEIYIIVRAWLLATGYHSHRGMWRRRRHG